MNGAKAQQHAHHSGGRGGGGVHGLHCSHRGRVHRLAGRRSSATARIKQLARNLHAIRLLRRRVRLLRGWVHGLCYIGRLRGLRVLTAAAVRRRRKTAILLARCRRRTQTGLRRPIACSHVCCEQTLRPGTAA